MWVQRAADRHPAWKERRRERGRRGETAEDVWSDCRGESVASQMCCTSVSPPRFSRRRALILSLCGSLYLGLFSLTLTPGPLLGSVSFLLQGPPHSFVTLPQPFALICPSCLCSHSIPDFTVKDMESKTLGSRASVLFFWLRLQVA